MVDLHTHSIHSDGTELPRAMVQFAHRAGLLAFAIADHDTVAGQEEAFAAGKEFGITVVPAIELTVDFYRGHIHILGYGFDIHHAQLTAALKKRADERKVQFYEKVALANRRLKAAGKDTLDADALLPSIKGSPGRPHIARAIVERGWAPSFRPAFDTYLIDYVPSTPAFSAPEALQLIHTAGGIASLAHPGSNEIGLRRFAKSEVEERGALRELIDAGVDGLEAYTPAHIKGSPSTSAFGLRSGNNYSLSEALAESKGFSDTNLIDYYLRLAKELNLLVTGGTDWHGPTFDAPAPGEFEVPDSVYEPLEKVLRAMQANRKSQ